MKLYEISTVYQNLINRIAEQETEVLSEDVLSELNIIEDALEDKLLAISKLIKNLEAEYEAVYKERTAMQNRERLVLNKIINLKKYIALNMETVGLKEVSCAQFKVRLRNNPAKLTIMDETQIPYEYKKMIVSCDRERIKTDLKNGIDISGAKLENGKTIQFT